MDQGPEFFTVELLQQETKDTFTIGLSSSDKKERAFAPGQYCMLYVFGFGEAPISIRGKIGNTLLFTIRSVGAITHKLSLLKQGDQVGVRGPFGNSWPIINQKKQLIIIAGGIGIAPLLSVLESKTYLSQFKEIHLLYGAKTQDDLLFSHELERVDPSHIHIHKTVDDASPTWRGHVGVVTALVPKLKIHPSEATVYMCGPEVMMKFAIHELMRKNMAEKDIYLSLERNMQCSTGTCGHCQLGPYFLCREGPIFPYHSIQQFLSVKEL
jgi:NAD(P)H-flavin reductase